jgi:cell division protein FtsL
MKAPIAKHEKNGSQLMICVICLVGVLVSAMSLGSMRLYGLYLEHRLAYVTSRIESVANNNAGLEERYSALLSPSRIYNYAKSQLNMVTAREVETIRLAGTLGGTQTSVSVANVPDVPYLDLEMPGFFDFLASYTGVANAQD